jgi:hypothetical protein
MQDKHSVSTMTKKFGVTVVSHKQYVKGIVSRKFAMLLLVPLES